MSLQAKFMLQLCLLVVAIRLNFAGNEKYRGDKLMSVEINSAVQDRRFKRFLQQSNPAADVWGKGGSHCDVQIKSKDYNKFIEFCKNENISYTVSIQDIEQRINYLKTLNGPPPPDGKLNYTRYNSEEEIRHEIFRLQETYPNLIDVRFVGRSFEKRPLLVVKVTANILEAESATKPITWIDGGIHAREWISVATSLFVMNQLITNYNKDKDITTLLSNNVFYFVPVFNPDGYAYSHTNDRLWRKTRRINKNSTCIGVDPNRNFNVQWGKGGGSTDPCKCDYQGTEAESEPCVFRYSEILRWKQKLLKAYWNLHSFYQILFIPNSYTITFPADINKLRRVVLKFLTAVSKRFRTFYGAWTYPIFPGDIITGAAHDWVHDNLNVTYSFALELPPAIANGTDGFLLPQNRIEPTSLEVLDGILAVDAEIDVINKSKNLRK